jgi:nucleotide-binding universal stress UspA family protein
MVGSARSLQPPGGMEIKTILAGTDFSDPAGVAISQALRVARRSDARLVLAHADALTEAQLLAPELSLGRAEEFRKILRDAVGDAHERLAAERQRHIGQGVDVSQILVDVPAEEGICRAAEALGADLVVVGSQGRTGLSRVLLGSVSERVVRSCRSAVMVARGPVASNGFHRILVPVDFGELSAPAIQTALDLAAVDAEVDILHAVHLPYNVYGFLHEGIAAIAPLTADLQADADRRGAELVAANRRPETGLRFHSVHAPAKEAILSVLDNGAYDLVVMGSRGLRGARRFFLGSTVEVTVRHAPCSVLVLHPSGE